MDANYLLTWLVGLSCGLSVARAMRAQRKLSTFSVLNLVVLLVLASGYFLAPGIEGYLGGGAWAILVVIPLLAYRRVSTLAGQRRYREAARLGRLVRWIHPAAAAQRSVELFDALADDLEGNTPAALEALRQLGEADELYRMPATVWALIIGRRWPELRHWIARRAAGSGLLTHPLAAAGWVRALGETGDLASLLRFHLEIVEPLGAQIGEQWLAGVRMMSLGYLGQAAMVSELADSGQLPYPPNVKAYWKAIARQAAGDVEGARPELQRLAHEEAGSLGAAAADRLTHPMRGAAEITHEAEAAAQLATIQRAVTLAGRFGSLAAPPNTRVPAVTAAIIVANLVFFAFELEGGSTSGRNLYEMGALVTPLAALDGQWWRVVTSAFLHFGWMHLAMNMAGLLFFGRYLEKVIGHVRYAVLYALAAPGSMALILLGRSVVDADSQLVVGASGGVMAVLGAVAGVMLARWRLHRAPMARRDGGMLVGLVAFQAVFDMATPQVSGLGHASGALLGFLLFWPLAWGVVSRQAAAP